MRLGITSAVASALIGFICAAVPLAAADAQAPAAAAAPAIAMTNALDGPTSNAFLSKYKAPKTPDANATAAGVAAAPAMIASAGVDCTPTDARLIGSADSTDKGVKTTYKAVEAACKDNLGIILVQANDAKASSADCLSAKQQAGDKNSVLTCTLPANLNPATALQVFLTKAHSPCVPTKAIYMGEGATVLGYEIGCQSGTGEIIQITKPRTPASAVVAGSCVAFPRAEDAPFPCTLTTEEANMAPVRQLASQAKPPCTPTKTHFLARESDGSEYYEFACQGGAGIVVHASNAGALMNTMSCGQAGGLGGGCKLTDAKASLAEAQGDYTAKAKAAGFDCNVTKFTLYAAKPDSQAVELACTGGNGGVMITKADKSVVFNCGRSQAEGYACSLSDKKLAFTAITDQLKAMDKKTCVASGISPRASATTAWIEVACSDGEPGWMIKYPRDSNTPSEVITCPEFTKRGAGECALPTNKKAA
jgi:hypothetical protein